MATLDEIVFHPLRIPADIDLVHGWMQQPHVAPWWHLAGPRDGVRDYLYARRRMRHRDCWIASDSRRPVAYLETFVVSDDPLARRYDAQPGDRGFNLLVGPPELLGSGTGQRLVRRLVTVLLGQVGITRVVCECDARNMRLIAFCRALGARPVATLAPPCSAVLLGWSAEHQLTSAAGTGPYR